jgi:CMP-2-keto-3-deoxyoctulosonic acid synthetase
MPNGIGITVMETTEATIGIDTEEDFRAAEARLAPRR